MATVAGGRAPDGLKIPAKFNPEGLRDSPHFKLQQELLRQPGAQTPDYAEQVGDILALRRGYAAVAAPFGLLGGEARQLDPRRAQPP